MALETQNFRPSLEKEDEATPLRVAQRTINNVIVRAAVAGFAEVIKRMMSEASSPGLPELGVRANMTGTMRAPRTPLRRKIGVRFISRTSRRKMAFTAWRPEVTRIFVAAFALRPGPPLRSLHPTRPPKNRRWAPIMRPPKRRIERPAKRTKPAKPVPVKRPSWRRLVGHMGGGEGG